MSVFRRLFSRDDPHSLAAPTPSTRWSPPSGSASRGT